MLSLSSIIWAYMPFISFNQVSNTCAHKLRNPNFHLQYYATVSHMPSVIRNNVCYATMYLLTHPFNVTLWFWSVQHPFIMLCADITAENSTSQILKTGCVRAYIQNYRACLTPTLEGFVLKKE